MTEKLFVCLYKKFTIGFKTSYVVGVHLENSGSFRAAWPIVACAGYFDLPSTNFLLSVLVSFPCRSVTAFVLFLGYESFLESLAPGAGERETIETKLNFVSRHLPIFFLFAYLFFCLGFFGLLGLKCFCSFFSFPSGSIVFSSCS